MPKVLPESSVTEMIDLINKPNPGSKEAVDQGCICPVLDNSYGKGYYGSGDFVISMDCPLHTMKTKELQEMIGIKDERK